jgi:hypothetical protein
VFSSYAQILIHTYIRWGREILCTLERGERKKEKKKEKKKGQESEV